MTNVGTVAVKQVDREAAWAYGLKVFGSDPAITHGKRDDSVLVQAFARHRLAAASAQPGVDQQSFEQRLQALCDEGWQFHAGEPPEYGSPLSQVYDAGIGYAWDRLAELLGVTDYEGGDGSEDYATDVMNTGRNILVAAGYANEDRDLLTADDLRAASPPLSTRQGEAIAILRRIIDAEEASDGWGAAFKDAKALLALPTIASEDRGEVERLYLADRFVWAAPGDQQEDAWLVRFCDKDCGEAIFTGPDAERDAWEHWNRYAPSYNIYVFRLARLSPNAITDDGARGWMEIADVNLIVPVVVGCWVENEDGKRRWSSWTVYPGEALGCDGTWGDPPTHAMPLPAAPYANVEKEAGNG